MAGAGGRYAIIIPTHDPVVERLGHYKRSGAGEQTLRHALELLMQAVPQVREAVAAVLPRLNDGFESKDRSACGSRRDLQSVARTTGST